METNMSELNDLFMSSKEYAWELTRLLAGRASIEKGAILFLDDALKVHERVLCFYIAIKIMALTKARTTAIATPQMVVKATGVNGNSARPLINKLVRHGFLRVQEDYGHSAYALNTRALFKLELFLDGGLVRLHHEAAE